MQLSHAVERVCPEREIIESLLMLDGKDILELGCGRAEITRLIAEGGPDRRITATEVDARQHQQNLLIDDLPNVNFVMAGGEAIPAADASFDVVLMFKSLHHVPLAQMDVALSEVKRVLRPGGLAYISEPVFAGPFNEVLRLFHDEEQVRLAAFRAIEAAVNRGELELAEEVFFNAPMRFDSFEDFERKVIQVTHTDHCLSPALHQQVKAQFSRHLQADGANFLMPMRVDLLRKRG